MPKFDKLRPFIHAYLVGFHDFSGDAINAGRLSE